MATLTPTQIKCLLAIRDGGGAMCLKGYRFNSAAVLERNHLIVGDRNRPYWCWKLTDQGRWIANLSRPADLGQPSQVRE